MIKTTFAHFPNLETDRLFLRQMNRADAADILALRSDARVNKYIDRKTMQSIDEAESFIEKVNNNISNGTSLYWAVMDKGTNHLIGTACIWNIVEADEKAELGYELMHDAWGKGYMQECISKILDFTLSEMGIKVIEAVIVEGNERSIKLAERNGFSLGRKEDICLIYTLTR